jgi:hypothetical protein
MGLHRAMWSHESVLARAVLVLVGLVGPPALTSLAESWKDAILLYAPMEGKADVVSW